MNSNVFSYLFVKRHLESFTDLVKSHGQIDSYSPPTISALQFKDDLFEFKTVPYADVREVIMAVPSYKAPRQMGCFVCGS